MLVSLWLDENGEPQSQPGSTYFLGYMQSNFQGGAHFWAPRSVPAQISCVLVMAQALFVAELEANCLALKRPLSRAAISVLHGAGPAGAASTRPAGAHVGLWSLAGFKSLGSPKNWLAGTAVSLQTTKRGPNQMLDTPG